MKYLILLLLILSCIGIWAHWHRVDIDVNTVDMIRVYKAQRKMELYSEGELLKSYRITLGFNPTGHKQREGDGKTPEGRYTINDKNPNSSYYLNVGVSYPNPADVAHAKAKGWSAGGDIKIHGLPPRYKWLGKIHRLKYWTAGCIAVSNKEMKEIYDACKIGAVIEIYN